MLNVWFWVCIALMTLAAMVFIAIPLGLNKKLWVNVLLLSFALLAIGCYWFFGNSQKLQQFWSWQKHESEVQQKVAQVKDPQILIDQLQDHLQQQPQSAEGWFLLGKLYISTQRYEQAEQSLRRAYQLSPDKSDYLAALAKADFFNHQGHLEGSLEEALKSVINSVSQPVDVLNLLAVNAYKNKDYHLAVKYWQQALALVPEDSPDSRTLMDMISQAQHQE